MRRSTGGVGSTFIQIPLDPCYFTYIIFLLLGLGILIPVPVYLMSLDFFRQAYEGDYGVIYWLNFGFNTGQLLGLGILILKRLVFANFWGGLNSHYFQLPMFLLSIFIMVITLVDNVYLQYASVSHTMRIVSMVGMIFLNFICGICTGIQIGNAFALAALFPWHYTQSVVTGIAGASAFMSIIRLIMKSISSTSNAVAINMMVFFSMGIIFQIGCVILWISLLKMRFSKFWIQYKPEIETKVTEVDFEYEPLSATDDPATELPENATKASYWKVFKKTISIGPFVCLTFVLTFILAPGLISDIPPEADVFHEGEWFPLILMTIYFLGDFLGRMSPRWDRVILISWKKLWGLLICRLVFIPVIILLVKGYFAGDFMAFLMTFLLAMSHGYCASLGMMYGSDWESLELYEKGYSGEIMTIYLNSGLFIGSTISVILGTLIHL